MEGSRLCAPECPAKTPTGWLVTHRLQAVKFNFSAGRSAAHWLPPLTPMEFPAAGPLLTPHCSRVRFVNNAG